VDPRALPPFTPLVPDCGLSLELGGAYPTAVTAWRGDRSSLEPNGSHFIYAIEGEARAHTSLGSFSLAPGMYACLLEGSVGGAGTGLVISRLGVFGMFQIGGPIEAQGRLRYIDGCTDSLLLAPPLRGDPCLNHLHIPAGTAQSRHTHPSLRVGVIARGAGYCVTPDARYPLRAGLAFLIAPDAVHSFLTEENALDVVVYHPDSDSGPTHHDHPMINRTILERA
jgi:quercetin dioxygenase-like cupin family protein